MPKTATPTTPSLTDFRRIVVKVGSALLVDAAAGQLKRDWLDSLAADLAGLRNGQSGPRASCWWFRPAPSRSAAPC